jgi:hypothetical protein
VVVLTSKDQRIVMLQAVLFTKPVVVGEVPPGTGPQHTSQANGRTELADR